MSKQESANSNDKKMKVFEYEGNKIVFEFENGQKMVNATQMAKIFKKKVFNFTRLNQTKEFIKALNSRYSDPSHGSNYKALRRVQGGTPEMQGTWMSERLALKFAAWLSVDFELWIYDTIQEILTNEIKDERIENAKWHLKKITDNIDETRNLLDTIPFQEENRRRVK